MKKIKRQWNCYSELCFRNSKIYHTPDPNVSHAAMVASLPWFIIPLSIRPLFSCGSILEDTILSLTTFYHPQNNMAGYWWVLWIANRCTALRFNPESPKINTPLPSGWYFAKESSYQAGITPDYAGWWCSKPYECICEKGSPGGKRGGGNSLAPVQ